MTQEEFEAKIKRLIDELKAMTNELGLSNTGSEFQIISNLFVFKFLNDLLLYQFNNRDDESESWKEFCDLAPVEVARMKYGHTIPALYKQEAKENFADIFDKALVEISKMNEEVFSIETTTGQKSPLFEPLSVYLRDKQKEKRLARRAINILYTHDFSEAFNARKDFFSSIFEYLIQDYNADGGGAYDSYFTPSTVAAIMAEMLVGDDKPKRVSIYDPTAGSGTLLMNVANKIGTKNCTIYSQDISQKSSNFLRINLILNSLTHSLNNVIEGNTFEAPAHRADDGSLKKFDYIVSNPPFKVDFSSSLPVLENDLFNRFFAGLPNVPKKNKSSMAIYPAFIQHVLTSMKPNAKAAIVVPTGFVSAAAKIEKAIRKHIVDKKMLMGVVHMPSNIFATTGTSVSVLFIDKSGVDKPVFVDASKLGKQVKIEGNQRTVLSDADTKKIISSFRERKTEVGFSTTVKLETLAENNYSFQAGQYLPQKEVEFDGDVNEVLYETSKAELETIGKMEQNLKLRKKVLLDMVAQIEREWDTNGC